jgi:hypothetical protein
MAKFLAIKTMKRAQTIERSGLIKARRARFFVVERLRENNTLLRREKVIYAMPVSTNYVVSHQWIAEIKRIYAHMPVSAIYFDLPDEQMVYFGHYAGDKDQMSAAEVSAYFYRELQKDDYSHLMGFEVLIPSDIVGGIKTVKHDMKLTGWRRDGRWMARNLNSYYGTFISNPQTIAYLKHKYA